MDFLVQSVINLQRYRKLFPLCGNRSIIALVKIKVIDVNAFDS